MEDVEASKDQMRDLHKTIAKVTEDTEELRFNTAIASMMEFMNATKKWDNKPRAALEPLLLLLAPYAPHIAEECWSRCGHSDTLTYEGWPQLDESLLVQDEITLPVQVCAYFLLLLSSSSPARILSHARYPHPSSCRDSIRKKSPASRI